MIFSNSPKRQSLERMMQQVHEIRPRGNGIAMLPRFEYTADMCDCELCHHYREGRCTVQHCPCVEDRIMAGTACQNEIMAETMKKIGNAAFRNRLNQFLLDSADSSTAFKNEKHQQIFEGAISQINQRNRPLVSAVFLLTAEPPLWSDVRRFIDRNHIDFSRFRPRGGTENSYTLLCCAKDLYLGTKHITISDLADAELVAAKIFALVCNAMAIRRFGLGAIKKGRSRNDQNQNQECRP